jgi:hypothetical protein
LTFLCYVGYFRPRVPVGKHVQLIYFDEVKFQVAQQPFYWLGGLIIDADSVKSIESEVDALAKKCFGISTLRRETEFHAAEIFHRKRNFKDWSEIEKRLDVIRSLASIVGRSEGIGRVYARLDPNRMIEKEDVDQKAFVFFVERVEMYLRQKKDLGLLIGDRESESSASVFAETLSHFREHGTPYAYGGMLERLIDTVHFTESHLSRMLQLADAYVWLLQLCSRNAEAYPQCAIINFVRENTQLLRPHRYKEWPSANSWIKA